MEIYAIGDLQGCAADLELLLERIDQQCPNAQLIFVGDLVNRGPASLRTLRMVRALGDRARTVLGNHDLHLLAIACGARARGRMDTMQEILSAPDCDELLTWLRQQPLALFEQDHLIVHAGVLPQWTAAQVMALSDEVAARLRGPHWQDFLRMARSAGFPDPRLVSNHPISITDAKLAPLVGLARFESATYRLFKINGLEESCEDHGQAVIYRGTLPQHPDRFPLDHHHVLETGRTLPVCGNTYRLLHQSRFQEHFDFIGDFSRHFGPFPGCGSLSPFKNPASTAPAPAPTAVAAPTPPPTKPWTWATRKAVAAPSPPALCLARPKRWCSA
jgi:hypothetical protein